MIFNKKLLILILFIIVKFFATSRAQSKTLMENNLYKAEAQDDGGVVITLKAASAKQVFLPLFTILYRDDKPVVKTPVYKPLGYRANVWNIPSSKTGTVNYFKAGNSTLLRASGWTVKQGKLFWSFPFSPDYQLTAVFNLPAGNRDPEIRFELKTKKTGWYSVGYTGSPEVKPNQFSEIWQPFIWQEKRFPNECFLSTENMCALPSVLVNVNHNTIGVIADPSEVPFRFPTLQNSRFGVLLRNDRGNAQPAIFSPVLGLANSYFKIADSYHFTLRLIFKNQPIYDTYRYMAQKIFQFRDQRQNATCSLNETLQNMINFAMNDINGGWREEYKAADYTTDVPGTVKNVSALHPLSIALITDNAQIYKRRALPMIEYLMSREKYLFAVDSTAKGQGASPNMNGPSANVSELAALYDISQKRSTVFKDYAIDLFDKPRVLNLAKVTKGSTWQNSLALYRMNGEKSYLEKARKGANEYIAKRIDVTQTDFSDVQIESGERFPTSWTPKWIDLLELYEQTKEKKYLDAAITGAKLFVNFVWMEPQVPAGNIVVNKGDSVGMYAYQNRVITNPKPMRQAEQSVAAWRVSQLGLVPESTTTYHINRAIFLTHYAAYLLRLSYYCHDLFFKDIARNAVVGRYANYPGYSVNGEYTTINQSADYPNRPLSELTYNTIYYNHVWPQIALLMDFLISDITVASCERINFPNQYAQGYAYLQSKVYGDRKGTFYGDKNVQLWMPFNLLKCNTIQANYLAGYGNGKLYLAFTNQSAKNFNAKVQLNADVVPYSNGKIYQATLWQDNHQIKATTMKDGVIDFPLSNHGITAVIIDDIVIKPSFQNRVFASAKTLSSKSYVTQSTEIGKVTGMIINMGKSLINSYIWLNAKDNFLKSATLVYKDGANWKRIEDATYPFEFSIPLSDKAENFTYRIEGVNLDGKKIDTDEMKLML